MVNGFQLFGNFKRKIRRGIDSLDRLQNRQNLSTNWFFKNNRLFSSCRWSFWKKITTNHLAPVSQYPRQSQVPWFTSDEKGFPCCKWARLSIPQCPRSVSPLRLDPDTERAADAWDVTLLTYQKSLNLFKFRRKSCYFSLGFTSKLSISSFERRILDEFNFARPHHSNNFLYSASWYLIRFLNLFVDPFTCHFSNLSSSLIHKHHDTKWHFSWNLCIRGHSNSPTITFTQEAHWFTRYSLDTHKMSRAHLTSSAADSIFMFHKLWVL